MNPEPLTPFQRDGIAWWNSLSPTVRVYWLKKADWPKGDASPEEAYRTYLASKSKAFLDRVRGEVSRAV